MSMNYDMIRPILAREHCRISPPRFLAECCKRRPNQGSFVLLYFVLYAFSELYLIFYFLFLICQTVFSRLSTVNGTV